MNNLLRLIHKQRDVERKQISLNDCKSEKFYVIYRPSFCRSYYVKITMLPHYDIPFTNAYIELPDSEKDTLPLVKRTENYFGFSFHEGEDKIYKCTKKDIQVINIIFKKFDNYREKNNIQDILLFVNQLT